uniref:uncharacterized protein LOC117609933 n=1 Tax=Osmia lignaria TaxID=473952 RepID=UPI0014797F42
LFSICSSSIVESSSFVLQIHSVTFTVLDPKHSSFTLQPHELYHIIIYPPAYLCVAKYYPVRILKLVLRKIFNARVNITPLGFSSFSVAKNKLVTRIPRHKTVNTTSW